MRAAPVSTRFSRWVLAALVTAAVPSWSAAGWAKSDVVVADFTDSFGKGMGAKANKALVAALKKSRDVEIVPAATLKAVAAKKKIKPKEMTRPATMLKLADAVGAAAVVTGSVARVKKVAELTVRVVSPSGAELLSKKVKLGKGGLVDKQAKDLATAIAESVSAPPGRTPVADATPPPFEEPKTPARDTPVTSTTSTGASSALDTLVASSSEPSPPVAAAATTTMSPIDETPVAKTTRVLDEGARPSFVSVSASFTYTSRSYQFCPEVTDCATASPPGSGTAAKYTSDAPYGGFTLSLDLFPLSSRDGALNGIGLTGRFGQSVGLKTSYTDRTGAVSELTTTQREIGVGLVYRYYFSMAGSSGWAGLRLGYLMHSFVVPTNDVLEVKRGTPSAELDIGIPLFSALRVEVTGGAYPMSKPTVTNTAFFGNAKTSLGYGVDGGLASDLGHPDWHLGLYAKFAYMHFGDTFENDPGLRPSTGVAFENYSGLNAGVKASF